MVRPFRGSDERWPLRHVRIRNGATPDGGIIVGESGFPGRTSQELAGPEEYWEFVRTLVLYFNLHSQRRTLFLYAKYSVPNSEVRARSSGVIWKRLI
jgi:hypothetical protein